MHELLAAVRESRSCIRGETMIGGCGNTDRHQALIRFRNSIVDTGLLIQLRYGFIKGCWVRSSKKVGRDKFESSSSQIPRTWCLFQYGEDVLQSSWNSSCKNDVLTVLSLIVKNPASESDLGARTREADDAKREILDFEFVLANHVFDIDVLRRRRSVSRLGVGR